MYRPLLLSQAPFRWATLPKYAPVESVVILHDICNIRTRFSSLFNFAAGTILLGHIAHIEWDDIGQAIPAFLTIILMPFTYSG